jgi:hypothetical protein
MIGNLTEVSRMIFIIKNEKSLFDHFVAQRA